MTRPTHFFNGRAGRIETFLFLLCLFSLFPIKSIVAQESIMASAPINGLAGAVCAIPDETYALQTVASGAFAEDKSLAFHFKNHYLLHNLYTISTSALIPISPITLGLSTIQRGPSHYKELQTSLSVAHRIQHTALGLRIHWNELLIEGFQTQHAFIFEFGGIVQLSPQVHFGASVYNLTLAKYTDKLLPVVLKCGLSGDVSEKLMTCIEFNKNIYSPLQIKLGALYEFNTRFKISTGYTYPGSTLHGGFIIFYKNINLAYSLTWHVRLGVSQDFSVAYTLSKRKS